MIMSIGEPNDTKTTTYAYQYIDYMTTTVSDSDDDYHS